jgi:hypothetical protein
MLFEVVTANVIDTLAVLMFVRVIFCAGLLVFTATVPKAKLPVDNCAPGVMVI